MQTHPGIMSNQILRALPTLGKLTHSVNHPHLPHVTASSAPHVLSHVKPPQD